MTNIKPTRAVAEAVNAMCERNDRTAGAKAGEVYLGSRFVLVTLRRPVVIEGEWEDVLSAVELVDIFDLMDAFRNGEP